MKHAPVSILEECAACGEIAFDGRRCSDCGSLSLDYLHDKIRRDIQGVKKFDAPTHITLPAVMQFG